MVGRLRLGACQTPEVIGDIDAALSCIEEFARRAGPHDVDLLLFPECFLQGYLVDPDHVRRHALNLDSAEFAGVLRRLAHVEQTLVVGVIEARDDRYFNSAVVITRGALIGVYRKTQLMPAESLFEKGDAYPTFVVRGVRFGINICADTRFAEPASSVAAQGARLLLVPSQNMMRRQAATQWKDLHNKIRAERVRETGMWLASADVTGRRDGHRVAYGPTTVMNPQTEVVARVPLMTTGMAVADIW
jgi:5-aminopentanamidase